MPKKAHLLLSPAIAIALLLSVFGYKANKLEKNTQPTAINLTQDTGRNELIASLSRINKLENGDLEYNFNERQSPFTVSKSNPEFDKINRMATAALEKGEPLKLIYTGHNTLIALITPAPAELSRYKEWQRYNLKDPEPRRNIRRFELDSLYFNYADWQKWKVFRLCVKTVPSLAVAKTIFNYCAAQGCYLGPTQEQPCIPFQYVRDGCFARAHKMRQIIEKKYGYCSEKVFSYGNLDVQASKWGGCCVGWWYHVAPLIRVSQGTGLRPLCYVIDPGMFNEPVLLSVWLAAQGNTTCDGASAVTAYSIQPSSAYTPANGYNSQTYTTDPNYTTTTTDLIYYNSQGSTCAN